MGGAQTVRAGVAAADDDDVLVLRGDERLVGNLLAPWAAIGALILFAVFG